jgi:hypothetical protein
MNFLRQLSLFDLLVLILCGGNLCLVIYAFLKTETDSGSTGEMSKHHNMVLIPGAPSQTLYLLFLLAWRYRWMRFYPGNSVHLRVMGAGILLSAASIFSGLLGTKSRGIVSVVVGASTGLLWFLALAVSSALLKSTI